MVKIGGTTYLSSTELAQLLGITSARVRHWRTEGVAHCPFIRIGRAVWYPVEDARAFASGYVNPKAASR